MSGRNVLKNGTVLELFEKGEKERLPKKFHITKLVSDRGASTVVYRAYHGNSSNIGILREYYPVEDDLVLKRDEDGRIRLDMSPESEAERSEYLLSRDKYLEPFFELRKLQIGKEQEIVFIPGFEIYYGSRDAEYDDGTVYIWTPAPQTETFDKICDEIHNNPVKEPEYKLYTVLSAIYSLAQCVRELHEIGLIHRDIKPDNFGFVKRHDKILTQSISLFDVDTICKVYPAPAEDKGTFGFMEEDSERKNDNWRDIYSIGATLFYAIIITERTRESDYKYQDRYYEEIPELVKTSRLISSSVSNSFPRFRSYLTRILRKCLCSRFSREEERYEDCETLAKDLLGAIRYIIPQELSKEYALGQKWVLQDARKWFDDMDEKNAELSLQYHLYKYPLYRQLGSKRNLNVLIMGFGRYGFKFLDLALQLAQNIEWNVKVTVVSDAKMLNEGPDEKSDNNLDEISDENLYLRERPEITKFFHIVGRENIASPYGEIEFRSEDLTKREDVLEIKSDSVRSVIEGGREYDYIFIDLGQNDLNRDAARIMDECRCGGMLNYVCEGHTERKEDLCGRAVPVRVSEDVRGLAGFSDIERKAFNVHLVWNENSNISYAVKKAEFLQKYCYDSCVSNVLAIKYKLWGIGIDLDGENVYEAAGKAEEMFKNDPEKRQYLAWLEHRRWVAEKICDGWTGRSLEECERIADTADDITKDIGKKVHACIVRSDPEWKLDGIDTGKWNLEGGIDTSGLDELDKLSVELHRFYERQALKMDLGDFVPERSQLLKTGAFAYFDEWIDAKRDMIQNGDRGSASACKALWIKLKDAIYNDESGELTQAQKKSIVESMERKIRPFFNRYEYKDFKKIDVDMIDKIPYILTYTDDLKILYPMVTFDTVEREEGIEASSEFVFRHIAAATILDPAEIHYLYYAPERPGLVSLEDSSRWKRVVGRIIAYQKRRGIRAKITLALFFHSASTRSIYCLSDSDRYDINVEYVAIKRGSASAEAAENYVRELIGKGSVLLEDTPALSSGWLAGSSMKAMVPNYRLDLKNRIFTDTDDCGWVRYVNCGVSVNARDIAELSGRQYSFDEKSDFGARENAELWKMYKKDSSRWKRCSAFLSREKNHLIELFSCDNREVTDGQAGTYRFLMPAECYASLRLCAQALAEGNFIGKESYVYLCSETVCCFVVKCTGKMRNLIDQMVSKPYALRNPAELKITPFGKSTSYSGSDALSIHFSGLKVAEVDLKARIEELVQNNQISNKAGSREETEREICALLTQFHGRGYIHDLSTKGGKVSFIYGSQTIKKLMADAGNMLEVRVYQELIQMRAREAGYGRLFNDIVGGITFRDENGKTTDQLDCLVIKGFRSLIIECKAQDGLSREKLDEYVARLGGRVDRYGMCSKGLLLIDSKEPLTTWNNDRRVIVKRVEEIEGDDSNKIAGYIRELLS